MSLKDREKRREYHREYMRGWYQRNKAKHISYVRKIDKKTKIWLKEYKATLKCEMCGENHPACLDFHHINPSDKKFAIGRVNRYMNIKLLQEEIAKCCVLCANCHRKEHYGKKEKEQNSS